MRAIIILILTTLTLLHSIGQTCSSPGQTPEKSIPVCGTSVFSQTNVALCVGRPVPVPSCNNGTVYTDINSFYYKFHCFQTGSLGFLITPINPTDDYDWQLFDVTNHNPLDIYTNDSLFVACNWSGVPGTTGAIPGVLDSNTCSSDVNSTTAPNKTKMPTLLQGHDYLLMVSHYTNTQIGYDLTFQGGTVNITDTIQPYMKYSRGICDGTRMLVVMNKKMRCSTLAADGSDFVLNPPLSNIIGAVGNCNGGYDMDSVELTLDTPLQPGTYNIVAKMGTDGGTVSDICYNEIPVGASIPVEVVPLRPTPFDSIKTDKACNLDQVTFRFKKPIQCSSVAADGSDFVITGPSTVSIASVVDTCNRKNQTWEVQLFFTKPVTVGGTYTITLVKGTDGNTLIDECDSASIENQQLSFTINAPSLPAITGKNTLCVGSFDTLTNLISGGVWKSSDTSIATVTQKGYVFALAKGNDTISYTLTDTNDCFAKQDFPIIIGTTTSLNIISGKQQICIGDSTTLTVNTPGGVWISKQKSIATINQKGFVKTVSVGKDTIIYLNTNTLGCLDSVGYPIVVNALPTISKITGKTDLCVGTTSTLNVTPSGGNWISLQTSIASVDNNGLVSGIKEGVDTIRYIVTNVAGCTDSTQIQVSIHPLPIIAPIKGKIAVCINDSIQLSNDTLGGVWASNAPNIATISSNGVVKGVAAGTVTIQYIKTTAWGCIDSVNTVITVNPLPVIAHIQGDSIFCIKDTAYLTAKPAGGVWFSPYTTVATITNTGMIKAISGGTDTIKYTYTDNNGCTSFTTKAITVKDVPVLTNIKGNPDICIGSFNGFRCIPSGGVWKSLDTSIVQINALGNSTGIALGTTTIRYILKVGLGCIDSSSTNVTVHPLPIIAPIKGDSVLCANQSITLTNSTIGGSWVSNNSNTASVGSLNGIVKGVNADTVTIRYKYADGFGCTDSVNKLIRVNPLPILAPITGSRDLCIGKTAILKNNTTGGIWNSNNTSIVTIQSTSGVVTGLKTGLVSISYSLTDTNKCSNTTNFVLIVQPLPIIGQIKGVTDVCVNQNTLLYNDTPRVGAWISSNASIASIKPNGVVTGLLPGNVTIKYIVNSVKGCVDSVATTVSVHALPVVSPIIGNATVCVGKSITLINSTVNGIWYSTNPTIATINALGVVQGVNGGLDTIRYKVTSQFGCSDSVELPIKVIPLASVDTIMGNQPICTGNTLALSSVLTGGVWSSLTPTIATIHPSTGIVTGLSQGLASITYKLTNLQGCIDTLYTTTVTIKGRPIPDFISPDVCLPEGWGKFIDKTILPLNPNPVSYVWQFGDANDTTTATTQNPTHHYTLPLPAVGYSVTLAVTANGCGKDTTILMPVSKIHPQPKAVFTTQPNPAEACINQPIVFLDNSHFNFPINKSIWYLGDNTIDTALNLNYYYSQTGNFWASHSIIDQYGCMSDTAKVLVEIHPYPIIKTDSLYYVVEGTSIQFTPIIKGTTAIGYEWTPNFYLNNNLIANPICTPLSDTVYTFSVTGKGNCVTDSKIQVVFLPTRLGIPNIFSPNDDGVHDTWVIPILNKFPKAEITILNRYGQKVHEQKGFYIPWNGKYNGTKLPVGTYYYIIKRNEQLPVLSGSVSIIW